MLTWIRTFTTVVNPLSSLPIVIPSPPPLLVRSLINYFSIFLSSTSSSCNWASSTSCNWVSPSSIASFPVASSTSGVSSFFFLEWPNMGTPP